MRRADDGATAWEPERDDDNDDCSHCGGSGGGPDEALRCPYCTRGKTRRHRRHSSWLDLDD